MSGSGKGLLGLWLYRSGEQEWAVKGGSPLHKPVERLVMDLINNNNNNNKLRKTKIVFIFSRHSQLA